MKSILTFFFSFLLITVQTRLFSQNLQPRLNNDCNDCQLNSEYVHNTTITFSGGNICCDRNFELIFADEFDSDSLDTNKWNTCYIYNWAGHYGQYLGHNSRVHENSGSYYKDENVIVGNGICTLQTKLETTNFPQICFPSGKCVDKLTTSSGMIMTKNWYENYHRYEIRCKVVANKNMWPSFWVFGWSTEIDVFEFISSTKPQFSLHKWFDNQKYSFASGELNLGDLTSDFHTYAVEHDKFFIRWYIDDILIYTASHFAHLNNVHNFNCIQEFGTYSRNLSFPECNVPALQVLVGSSAQPNRKDDNGLPNSMLIDYIRIYKLVPDDSDDGCKLSITSTSVCKQTDTLQICLEGGQMNGSNWQLPPGLTMYQNPSLNIKSKTIFNGVKDTIIYDTTVNSNCIKVIANNYTGNGKIKYLVPEECKFLSGDYLEQDVVKGLPNPSISYFRTCNTATICVHDPDKYTVVSFLDSGFLMTQDPVTHEKYTDKICKQIKLEFSSKFSYTNTFINVKNRCGSTLKVIKFDKNYCDVIPNQFPEIERISVSPNPAINGFYITPNPQLGILNLPNLHQGQIFKAINGAYVETFNLINQTYVFIDSENYTEGEYIIMVRDIQNNYYSSKVIINKY